MKGPFVSICIPTYEQTEYLEKNLQSILEQDYVNYEVIITDDTPDDQVKKIVIEEYQSKFGTKLRFYKNKKRLGSPENWNEAIRKAKGAYIKILHHDDWFTKSYSLRYLVDSLESNPNSSMVACYSYAVDQTKGDWIFSIKSTDIDSISENPNQLFFGNKIGAPSVTLFRRNSDAYFSTDFKWLVDVEFYIRYLSNNKKLEVIHDDLIAISTEGKHKVTNECIDNDYLILSEQKKLFDNIIDSISKNQLDYYEFILKMQNAKSSEVINKVGKVKRPLKYFKMKVSQELKKKLNILSSKLSTGAKPKINSQNFEKKSFSQVGEDLIVKSVLDQLNIKKGNYLDIGAHHPLDMNNTHLLYLNGFRGVNIEPDPDLISEFLKLRSEDVNLNIGINFDIQSSGSEMDFYIMSAKSLNTFSLEEAKRIESYGSYSIEEVKKIKTKCIEAILNEYFSVDGLDYLTIDSEGMDFEILKSINFDEFRPKVICAETLTYVEDKTEEKRTNLIDYIKSLGYILFADTYINSIFVDKNVWENR